MKKVVFLILIAGLGAYLWYSSSDTKEEPVDKTGAVVGTSFQPDASNATFIFDEGAVRLSGGKNETQDEIGFITETELLDHQAFGDLNKDEKNDVIVLLSQSAGASGTFIYVAGYVSGPVSYKGSNAVFLGDRIAPQSISISNGVATVKFLDRKEDEPFSAEPTVSTSKQFVFQNGELQER